MTKEQKLAIIRHTFTFIGGIFITKGILDEAMFETISGSALTLISTIWSLIEKRK